MSERLFITGTGIVCAAGGSPADVWETIGAGRSAIGPIQAWDGAALTSSTAGEVTELGARDLVPERKTHKFLRRTDFLGLYAAERAIEEAGLAAYREGLDEDAEEAFADGTGVYAAAGGATYQSQYDFFPLLSAARGDMQVFGRDADTEIHPMWLLRTLPNNVLCHVGIRNNFKGPNACVTNHCVSGALALTEAKDALRRGYADRAVVVGHDTPIEPQTVYGYQQLGLLSEGELRPFDATRDGAVLGEGAAAVVLETESAATARGADVLAELLGTACTTEAEGLLGIREDGDGPERAIKAALDDAGIEASDVGLVVAHGNGTRRSDASEAAAIGRVFGADMPPVTAFKWAFGHMLAAAGLADAVLAALALRHQVAPGIATLREVDAEFADLPVSREPQFPRSEIALVLSRGFAGTNGVLILKGGGTEAAA